MSRRLIKGFEDLYTHYDGTVRPCTIVVRIISCEALRPLHMRLIVVK